MGGENGDVFGYFVALVRRKGKMDERKNGSVNEGSCN
jgi:hypothetical protein